LKCNATITVIAVAIDTAVSGNKSRSTTKKIKEKLHRNYCSACVKNMQVTRKKQRGGKNNNEN